MNKQELEALLKTTNSLYTKATEAEEESGYHADLTMERKYEEGWLDALNHVYVLTYGHTFNPESN